jgi:hypothetical protein
MRYVRPYSGPKSTRRLARPAKRVEQTPYDGRELLSVSSAGRYRRSRDEPVSPTEAALSGVGLLLGEGASHYTHQYLEGAATADLRAAF